LARQCTITGQTRATGQALVAEMALRFCHSSRVMMEADLSDDFLRLDFLLYTISDLRDR